MCNNETDRDRFVDLLLQAKRDEARQSDDIHLEGEASRFGDYGPRNESAPCSLGGSRLRRYSRCHGRSIPRFRQAVCNQYLTVSVPQLPPCQQGVLYGL
jgi:hypothetical protein